MSEKPNEPKSKIGDLPEKMDELSAEELEHVAGGTLRSPATSLSGKAVQGLHITTQVTLAMSSGDAPTDVTSSSLDT